MELTIKNNHNYFEIKGILVKYNVNLFQKKFQDIFDERNSLTLNITGLNRIDSFGINAIAKIHNEAISKQKRFSIIGLGNNELFNHFKTIETVENLENVVAIL
ncbi:MAG TPA: STAS domain-containing protein [Flavobacteriaceae bacterium]|nr:STAS domain-containing protein [Flavobacteriaceae bacterium]